MRGTLCAMEKIFLLDALSCDGKIHEVGRAEVCCIAGISYLLGTPKEDVKMWTTEWFYIADVPLYDTSCPGLPIFSHSPPKKRFNWQPWSFSQEDDDEDDDEVSCLASQVSCLARKGLTIINAILWGVQRLQQRIHPLWRYNGTDDATRSMKKGFQN